MVANNDMCEHIQTGGKAICNHKRGMARYIQGKDTGEYPSTKIEFIEPKPKENTREARRLRNSSRPF